jgi:polar amino acid transport system substrate-binding protein
LELIGYRDHLEEQVRRRTEELARADRLASLGTLVSGVAHEINNPNNFIILNGDNLADIWKEMRPILDAHAAEEQGLKIVGIPYDMLRNEMDHLIGGIREGARRIRTIVAHLKDFARQGPMDMEQEVDLAKVIDAASIIVANAIKKCTGNFSVNIASDAPRVRGNFQKLEQVVINLLTNACQALTDRDQEVTVSVKSCEDQSVCLTVKDTGMGIPAEILPQIFDPFFTTKRDSGGTGLGLSISYGIVKDHKGTMVVKSEVGRGTEFIVKLPVFTKDNN